MRWGIRAIIGISFSEIFFGNCLALGIPCLTVKKDDIEIIQKTAVEHPTETFLIDLESISITFLNNSWHFSIEPGPLKMLKSGNWDATSLLLDRSKELDELMGKLPYLNQFQNL